MRGLLLVVALAVLEFLGVPILSTVGGALWDLLLAGLEWFAGLVADKLNPL